MSIILPAEGDALAIECQPQLVWRRGEMAGELFNRPKVMADRTIGVITTLEFLAECLPYASRLMPAHATSDPRLTRTAYLRFHFFEGSVIAHSWYS